MKLKNDRTLAKYAVGQADQAGYLFKRSDRTFYKHWCLLRGNMFFYFEKKTDREPLGVIILEGCSIEVSDEFEMNLFIFKINFPSSCKIYYLAAETHEIMETWILTLSRCSFLYLRCILEELTHSVQNTPPSTPGTSSNTSKSLSRLTSSDSSNNIQQQQQGIFSSQRSFSEIHQTYGKQFDGYLKEIKSRSGKDCNVSAEALLADLLS